MNDNDQLDPIPGINKKTEPKRRGRPPIELDEEKVYRLACMGCTVQEIAHYFDVSKDVIERRYIDIVHAGLSNAKMSLRRTMLKAATQTENVAMMIWLSKQWLGMREPVNVDLPTSAPEINIKFIDNGKK